MLDSPFRYYFRSDSAEPRLLPDSPPIARILFRDAFRPDFSFPFSDRRFSCAFYYHFLFSDCLHHPSLPFETHFAISRRFPPVFRDCLVERFISGFPIPPETPDSFFAPFCSPLRQPLPPDFKDLLSRMAFIPDPPLSTSVSILGRRPVNAIHLGPIGVVPRSEHPAFTFVTREEYPDHQIELAPVTHNLPIIPTFEGLILDVATSCSYALLPSILASLLLALDHVSTILEVRYRKFSAWSSHRVFLLHLPLVFARVRLPAPATFEFSSHDPSGVFYGDLHSFSAAFWTFRARVFDFLVVASFWLFHFVSSNLQPIMEQI